MLNSSNSHRLKLRLYCLCGSLSGIASSTATFPLDLVRRRKQLERAGGRAHVYNSTGIMGMFKHIIRNEGFRGLYRGILPEYYENMPPKKTNRRRTGNHPALLPVQADPLDEHVSYAEFRAAFTTLAHSIED
ncbi:hypothetical protein CQW23_32907 [Capsicum baccatum]|uniref:Uncharacterized protein n=1 Tax=Capsicum baccatum TaxID=33114 RepID=A0A2G2V3C3_CAPBA|nr:hypothetical protein CQW23_32907 [Capsicum baccatum]